MSKSHFDLGTKHFKIVRKAGDPFTSEEFQVSNTSIYSPPQTALAGLNTATNGTCLVSNTLHLLTHCHFRAHGTSMLFITSTASTVMTPGG